MLLRNHPLMLYRGVPSCPAVAQSNIQPSKDFLFIDFEESSYIGYLTVDDHGFCAQLVRFLQAHWYNRPITEIGSLDLSYTL
jgi:hypothetical protein